MKIACIQFDVTAANPRKNFEAIARHIKALESQNVDLVVLPELSISGYLNGDIWEQTAFLLECEHYGEKLKELSIHTDILFGNVGIDWTRKNEDGRVRKYNAAFYAHKNEFTQNKKTGLFYWPKTLMPNYRYFDDSRYFYDLRKLAYENHCRVEDLYEPIVFKKGAQSVTIGLSICEDAWDNLYSFSPLELFQSRYPHDFFVNLSASPFTLGKQQKRETLFQTLCEKIKCPILYVNSVGVQNTGKTILSFDGDSRVFQPEKTQPAQSHNLFTEQTQVFEWINQHLQSLTPHALATTTPSAIEQICSALEYTLKKCCSDWGIQKIVVGVSGGIDSAVSATLCTRVLGKDNVYLVNMPSRYNSSLTKNAAHALAQNLGCPYAIAEIETSVQQTHTQLKHIQFSNANKPLALTPLMEENIQSRDRGARLLSAIAASLGAVFTCNANKSELTVGYFTLYGDSGGFLCPLGDLWKHQVYALAQYYNENIFKRTIIPEDTLKVVPSAELSQAQDVTAGKGDPLVYPYHDHLFQSWIEHWERATPHDCLVAYRNNTHDDLIGCAPGLTHKLFPTEEKFQKDLMHWWHCYKGMGAFKRLQTPPIIAVSRRAFGTDHRECVGTH